MVETCEKKAELGSWSSNINLYVIPYGIYVRILRLLDRNSFAAFALSNRHCALMCYVAWERRDKALPRLPVPFFRYLPTPHSLNENYSRKSKKRLAVVLASYPRSGNTLLRRLLEEATGVITGSDSSPLLELSQTLTADGLQGEGVVDDRVHIVKTHWPERKGWKTFSSRRVIVLLRNPFHAIESYFHMCLTNSHDMSLREDMFDRFKELWDGMVKNEIHIWRRFSEHWLSASKVTEAMVVVRYEDLKTQPSTVVERILHEIWPEKVKCRKLPATAVINNPPFMYTPRMASVGCISDHFSAKQIAYCYDAAGDLLRQFGYDDDVHSSSFSTSPPVIFSSKCKGTPREIFVNNNDNASLRSPDSIFGRGMRFFRRQITQGDTQPLPRASRGVLDLKGSLTLSNVQ